VIANRGRDDGYAGFIEADIAVGNPLSSTTCATGSSGQTSTRSPRSNAGQTITIESNALRSLPRKRLAFFIRQPPMNESSR
jgi:hypothetical protein